MAKHSGVKDSGEYFVITPASRKITVPHIHKAIGTVGDHNSEQITFMCPQMVDGHDISQCHNRYVTWVNVNGESGHDELQVVQPEYSTEGMIYLAWTIRNALTVAKGIVQFSIHFEDFDENKNTLYRWSTTTCKDCEILESINGLIATYEAVYVAGDTLVFADYTPVTDGEVEINTTIVPTGNLKITENGTHAVGEYASVEVCVNYDELFCKVDYEFDAIADGLVTKLTFDGVLNGVINTGMKSHEIIINPDNLRGTIIVSKGGYIHIHCYKGDEYVFNEPYEAYDTPVGSIPVVPLHEDDNPTDSSRIAKSSGNLYFKMKN